MTDFLKLTHISEYLKAYVSLHRSDNKEKRLISLQLKDKPKIFILGTIHDNHFNRKLHYSFDNVLNVIKNVKPDVVLLESRNETYDNYGAIDGPTEMSVCCSYCHEQNVFVGFIDWWLLSNRSSTLKERDDHIFINIQNVLINTDASKTVLIICGDYHLAEQKERFLKNRYNETELTNTVNYFVSDELKPFTYPKSLKDDIERKISYYKNEFKEEVEKNITDERLIIKKKNQGDYIAGYLQTILENNIIPNKLYR